MTRTTFSRLRSLVVCTKHILPIYNLVLIKDYPDTLQRLEDNDSITILRFRVLYVLLSLRLVNTVVLLVKSNLSTSSRILLCDFVFFLNVPSSYNLFNFCFVFVTLVFYYANYHLPRGNPTIVMGSRFMFDTNTAADPASGLRKYIRLVVACNIGFFQGTLVMFAVFGILCQVRMHQFMSASPGSISAAYYLGAQWNWFLLLLGYYSLIHIASITLGNLVANNCLAIFRLRRTVHTFASKLRHKNLFMWMIFTYFRSHCDHLRMMDKLSKVYSFMSLGIIMLGLPISAYINMLIMMEKIPEHYMVPSYQIVGGQWMAILMTNVLFSMYPPLVHHNVKTIHSISLRTRLLNVRTRWKLAAHFEHFHVADSHRYGFTYLGISLVTLKSFLIILKTYSEIIMISYNLIV